MIDSWKTQNREFWKKQALKYKSDVKTVNFDPLEEELELHYLQQVVKDGENVLDIGCGNGRATIALAADSSAVLNKILYSFLGLLLNKY